MLGLIDFTHLQDKCLIHDLSHYLARVVEKLLANEWKLEIVHQAGKLHANLSVCAGKIL